jgi:hypothetical protein
MWFWFCTKGFEAYIPVSSEVFALCGSKPHKAALKQSRSYLSSHTLVCKAKANEKKKAYKPLK